MSFFELDGGAKKAPAKKAPAKKAPAKKAPAKKKALAKKKASAKKAPAKKAPAKKKGGNFLGTVSELFAPAGWENFVTAAGLLALDRTDNYLRKSKDSKKQRGGADDDTPKMEEEMTGGARKRISSRKYRGGADDTPNMEEEMTGGARKRISSRKQRGGSDGHHTIEALDAMTDRAEEIEIEMTSQTGGAKKKSKGRGRTQKGGDFMSPEQKEKFLELYYKTNNERPSNNKLQNSDRRIQAILEAVGAGINQNVIGELDRAVLEARQLIKNRNNAQLRANNAQLVANNSGQLALNTQLVAENQLTGTIFNSPNSNTAKALQQANNQGSFQGSFQGGKSFRKKPKTTKNSPPKK